MLHTKQLLERCTSHDGRQRMPTNSNRSSESLRWPKIYHHTWHTQKMETISTILFLFLYMACAQHNHLISSIYLLSCEHNIIYHAHDILPCAHDILSDAPIYMYIAEILLKRRKNPIQSIIIGYRSKYYIMVTSP